VVTSLQFDKTKLLSASLDGTVKTWDLKGTLLTNTLKCDTTKNGGVNCVKFQEDLVVCGCVDNSVQLWDLRAKPNQQCVRLFSGHTDEVSCVDFVGTIVFLILCLNES